MAPSLLDIASALAETGHAGQCDKAGQPYIEHLRRVASYVDQDDHEAIAAALLHDYLEDHAGTPDNLDEAGIPTRVVDVIRALDRNGKPTDRYYAQIRQHPAALEVKLADLADNTDPHRLAELPPEVAGKLKAKYVAAYAALGVDPDDGERRRNRVPR